MKSGKWSLGGSSWKPQPTVSSTLHFPLWLQPSSADGAGKSDSQLACLRGQGDREQGPVPTTQPHPSSLASSSHSPRGGQGPGAPHLWVGSPRSTLPLLIPHGCINSALVPALLSWALACPLGRTPGGEEVQAIPRSTHGSWPPGASEVA